MYVISHQYSGLANMSWPANKLLRGLFFSLRYAQIRNPRGVLHARCMHAAGEEQRLGIQFSRLHALSPITSRYTKPDCRDREIRLLEHHIHNHTVTRALRLLSSKGQKSLCSLCIFRCALASDLPRSTAHPICASSSLPFHPLHPTHGYYSRKKRHSTQPLQTSGM